MKQVCLVLLGAVVLWLAPVSTQAVVPDSLPPTTISETEKGYFLKLIAELTQEVLRLQMILQQRSADERTCTLPTISLFNHPIETGYCVKDGKLLSQNGEAVREIDQTLFSLFTGVVGQEAVNKSVIYWRIFNDEEANTDAFVETVDEAGHFMVSVNRFGYLDKAMINKSYAELFTHEYAHIILLNQSELTKKFKTAYWTASDLVESTHLEQLSSTVAFRERNAYFTKNTNRFVSDYAVQSVDEDMAETFLAVVMNGWPSKSDTSLKAKKQRFFQENSVLSAQRDILRDNLRRLGVFD